MNLKYAVIGAGAIGGFYGGMLARSGKDVKFIFHSDYEYVKSNGLKVDSISGDFHLDYVQAYDRTDEMGICDVVLVGLKTTNNAFLKDLLPPLIGENTLVILIQNGLGVEADLARYFPDLNIAGGLAYICSNKIGPGHIAHLDLGKLSIGLFQGNAGPLLGQVCEDFNEARVPAEVVPNLKEVRWKKLLWNIPYNGLAVVLNTTTDKLMGCEESRDIIKDLMLEVVHAANHCGVAIKEGFAYKMFEMTETMTPYAPSMKLDFDHQRELEIEYIYSRPIKAALEAGYEMRNVSMLEKQLRFIQKQYLK